MKDKGGGDNLEFTGVIIDDSKKHSSQLFNTLVEKHHKQAYNVAYRMAGNHSDAEDITQEAFIRAYRFFGNYNRELPFEAWLYKIMSRVFIGKLRKKPNFTFRSLDQPITSDSNNYFLELPDDSGNPEQVILSRTLDDRIQKALQKLPLVFRMTVIYADVEGLSYEEIAEVMSVNIGTVRSRLHRGRKMLREKLGDISEFV